MSQTNAKEGTVTIIAAADGQTTPKKVRKPRKSKAIVVEPSLLMNRVSIKMIQDTTKKAKRTILVNGAKTLEEYDKPVKHEFEAYDETNAKVTALDLSNFLVGALYRHQLLNKAQGKAAFDTSLPITLDISVESKDGAKQQVSGIKFSTNVKALERILTSYPMVVATVFNPQAFRLGTTSAQILGMVNNAGNAVLLPEVATTQASANVKAAKEILNAVDPTVEIPLNK